MPILQRNQHPAMSLPQKLPSPIGHDLPTIQPPQPTLNPTPDRNIKEQLMQQTIFHPTRQRDLNPHIIQEPLQPNTSIHQQRHLILQSPKTMCETAAHWDQCAA